MTGKTLIITAIILLLASMTCLGVMSCASDSPPLPSDTEIPGGSTDESQAVSEETYRSEMAAIAAELNTLHYDLDQLLVNPEIENVDWILEATLALADIVTLCDEAWQIAPPDSMMEAQATFLEAINHFDDAVDSFIRGIDKVDIDLLNQASAEMWLATEILAQVTELSE